MVKGFKGILGLMVVELIKVVCNDDGVIVVICFDDEWCNCFLYGLFCILVFNLVIGVM